MRRTPALIVGGGPAGSVAALALARAGVPHLLVERQREIGDALCGGFLSWRTLETLRNAGFDPETLAGQVVRRLRIVAAGRTIEAALPRPARGVSRHALDTALLATAERAGAAVERGVTVREVEAGAARLADGHAIAADALFLASGKHDVRGLARPAEARGSDPALGLRVRLAHSPALDRLIGDAIELHLFDRGYAGVVRQEDGTANLCMAVHRSRLSEAGGPEALLAALAGECPQLGERLAHDRRGAIDAVANVPYGWRARDGVSGLFRLGDQAAVIPSLAGEGMGIAIASGLRAAAAYRTGGAAAAPGYQRAFARAARRPLAIAGLARDTADTPRLAALLLPLLGYAPRLLALVAEATRITPARRLFRPG